MDLHLDAAARLVRDLVSDQGEILIRCGPSVELETLHDDRDITTEADLEVERNIKDELRRHFPGHGLLGEETGAENEDAEYLWMIDPIDGSKYYAARASLFSISVGLLHRGEPVLGVVYAAASRQCFHAYSGGGAFVDDERLQGSAVGDLREVIANVDTPRTDALSPAERRWFEAKLVALTRVVYRVRALGQGSLAACWLASGALDAYVDLTGYVKPQDLAAGRVIMAEAGMRVELLDVGVGPPRLLAAPPAVFDDLRRLLLD